MKGSQVWKHEEFLAVHLVPLLSIKTQLVGQVEHLKRLALVPWIILGRGTLDDIPSWMTSGGESEDLGFEAGITLPLM